ncbi:class II fumarate hydratase [Alteromonas aestuariivivens]|uniref:fumarate hydratase n=1 Tax=Alteromonas aestuariivivens TaxID=1938339 RepID=A0A3D8M4J9_9ALTE|nr:class II fumarate hydratase [Alteromonas aestuariivivens]RDV24454.1 class II fumarate hydratase [Alteromonas aestuariivivens]
MSQQEPPHPPVLYQTQTKLALDNFQFSGVPLPPPFIHALGFVKAACATANRELGLLAPDKSEAIWEAAMEIAHGEHDMQFPIDVFQTGSGTSTNMNANEVIATLACRRLGSPLHPNDDVNLGQSSNDVIPTTIHVSALCECNRHLIPAIEALINAIAHHAKNCKDTVKTGRTHLMDAMPITLGQEMSGWSAQLSQSVARIKDTLVRVSQLAIGGTAVGTGVNSHPGFGARVASALTQQLGITFMVTDNHFAALSAQDTAVELSGQLNTLAVALMKISNDLRWMNSGPLAGLGEITLPKLQAGSSIMPGKVNPVIPEAVTMVCAQVMGNHQTIVVAGQSGNFQLNVMLPLIATNLLNTIELLTQSCRHLSEKVFSTLTVNSERLAEVLAQNPILVTALNRKIGYEKGAQIAQIAYQQKRPILDVALEMTDLDEAQLRELLNPKNLV